MSHSIREAPLRVAIVGDFDPRKHSHWATEAALFHAAGSLGVAVEPHWIHTSSLDSGEKAASLREFAGVWAAPGSPFASADGMLRAIRVARELNMPFLGTCAGFQYALIEFSRNVLGLADADTGENGPTTDNIVISLVECSVDMDPNTPRLNGTQTLRPEPRSLLAQLCGSSQLNAEFFCSWEANPRFIERWEAAGLMIAARGPHDEMRAFELLGNRFFLATLFQPQLSSSFQRPHPIVSGFVRTCLSRETL